MHSDSVMVDRAYFSAANMVGVAEAFLDGKADADALNLAARSGFSEVVLIGEEGTAAKEMLVAARLLVLASLNASVIKDRSRLDRWKDVMKALVKLARHEATRARRPA